MNKLIISSNPFVVRAAKINDDKLEFFFIRKKNDKDIVGNIYKGVVRDIVPHLGAAFIDIGYDKRGFLCTCESDGLSNLKEGDCILVQARKPPISSKGPKLSNQITLAGNYLVLAKDSDTIGISKHIDNVRKREELRRFLSYYKEDGYSFITRRSAQFATGHELESEINYLKSLVKKIDKKFQVYKAPSLIYEEPTMPSKIIRDYCSPSDEVVIDDKTLYYNILQYLNKTQQKCVGNINLYTYFEPIFKHFGIIDEIKELENNVVPLKSGGYIVIEKTEAFFSIDVNSGTYKELQKINDCFFETNKEAAREIFRQIKLRDLGGIIVIDFIDMKDDAHKKALEEILVEFARNDKKKTFVTGISPFGLVEISRKKDTWDMFDEMFDKCDHCFNNGLVKNTSLICSDIYERIFYAQDTFLLHANYVIINLLRQKAKNLKNLRYIINNIFKNDEYYLEVIKNDRKIY